LAGGCFVSRRTYVESSDFVTTVKQMEDPMDVLKFMAEHADSDAATHEAALRALGRMSTMGDNYKKIVDDPRFHAILSSIASRLDDCDARTISMIADASARFRISTSELSEFAQRLAEVVTRREDAFSPRNLANVAIALSIRGVRDAATIEFIKAEAIKLVDDMEPAHCILLLEAFRRWGVFDRQLVDVLVERMCDEIDRFSARDVVDAFAVISRLGLARGFLLRRLCTLAFDNLRQFTPRELSKMSYALAKLRFLTPGNIADLADVLKADLHRLRGSQVTELLFALAMADAREQIDLARTLSDQYLAEMKDSKAPRTLSSLIDFAWSLCALDLVDEYQKDFEAVMKKILEEHQPQNRVPLMKLFDVLNTVEHFHKNLNIKPPAAWTAACDDADRFEMDRLESSRLHNELVMRFDHLRGSANGNAWQLRMLRNQPCGPYRVDLYDEASKVALDVETISWPTSRRLKHRILVDQGYKPLLIEYWEWRRVRTEEEQMAYLKDEVTKLLEQ